MPTAQPSPATVIASIREATRLIQAARPDLTGLEPSPDQDWSEEDAASLWLATRAMHSAMSRFLASAGLCPEDFAAFDQSESDSPAANLAG